jgi:hypothetical protein
LIPMIQVVKQFTCIPATSVPSKQVFSKAGDLIRKKEVRCLIKILICCYSRVTCNIVPSAF